MCDNCANEDDIEGAVTPEVFEKYKELKEAQNSCLNKIFTQDTSDENFYCPKCKTQLTKYQGKCPSPSCNFQCCGVCALPFNH